MAKKGGATLAEDAPWRVSSVRPVPKISRSPVLSISQSPETDYAISVMKVVFFIFPFVVLQSNLGISLFLILGCLQHPNPVGGGFAMEAVLESAGPDCVVPGQVTPLRLLGVKVHFLKNLLNKVEFSMMFECWNA